MSHMQVAYQPPCSPVGGWYRNKTIGTIRSEFGLGSRAAVSIDCYLPSAGEQWLAVKQQSVPQADAAATPTEQRTQRQHEPDAGPGPVQGSAQCLRSQPEGHASHVRHADRKQHGWVGFTWSTCPCSPDKLFPR